MPSLTTLGIICGVIIAGCKLLDSWMLKDEKRQLHQTMSDWLVALGKMRVPDMHKPLASVGIRAFDLLSARSKGIGVTFGIITVSSVALTTIAILLGVFIEVSNFGCVLPKLFATFGRYPGQMILIYLVNLFFDTITCTITYLLLKRAAKTSALIAALLIVADMCIAYFFWFGCAYFTVSVGEDAFIDLGAEFSGKVIHAVVTLTTLIPTAIYLEPIPIGALRAT